MQRHPQIARKKQQWTIASKLASRSRVTIRISSLALATAEPTISNHVPKHSHLRDHLNHSEALTLDLYSNITWQYRTCDCPWVSPATLASGQTSREALQAHPFKPAKRAPEVNQGQDQNPQSANEILSLLSIAVPYPIRSCTTLGVRNESEPVTSRTP